MNINRREFMRLAAGAAAIHTASGQGWAQPSPTFRPAEDPTGWSLREASAKLRSGAITAVELTQACLARIAICEPKLNSFITVMRESALARAAGLDMELKAGRWRGRLHGIPVSLKDIIDTAGIRTTAASAVFADRVPNADATVAARLKEGGAVIIGKNNLYEFAMRGSYFGPALNPWALDHETGGSSSGSSVAVSAGLCFGALGTDTGGSIRKPASYCGIVGLKATYGLVPIRGIIPSSPSLDCCGPLARTVEDAAIMLNLVAGYDKLDITSAEHPKEDYLAALGKPISGLRLGIPVSSGFYDELDPEVGKAVEEAIKVLGAMTRATVNARLPRTMDLGSELRVEAWAYHEEIYKHEADKYTLVDRRQLEQIAAGPNKDAAEYIRTRWALELLRRTIDDSFTDFDLVVLPSERILPPPLPGPSQNGSHAYPPADPTVTSAFTSNSAPFNMYGIQAISVPCGFSKGGLPIGLMIAGPRFSEGKVLALAHAYERGTEWHKRRPALGSALTRGDRLPGGRN